MGFSPVKKVDERIKQYPNSDIVAVIDGDYITFKASAVGDDPYIEVTHTKSGKIQEFKNVTEFRGRGKIIGGWLGDLNDKRLDSGKPIYSLDDFSIEAKVRRKKEVDKDGNILSDEKALINILYSAKAMVKSALEALETHNYKLYLGGEETFRLNKSTLQMYKGGRVGLSKPLVFKEVRDYLIDTFNTEVVTGLEVDDQVIIDAYENPNHVVVAVDKDAMAQPVKVFNPDKSELGIVDCTGLGELYRDDKKEVRGYGYKFLIWQCLAGDRADCYSATVFSDKNWGDVKAFDCLVDCKDEKEVLESAIQYMKELYPESLVVEDWRGNPMMIDWLSVFREMFQLAAMQRFVGDSRSILTEFTKYSVVYDYGD